jgi:hypothetical protein
MCGTVLPERLEFGVLIQDPCLSTKAPTNPPAYIPIVDQQLAKAGLRLARLLNKALRKQ